MLKSFFSGHISQVGVRLGRTSLVLLKIILQHIATYCTHVSNIFQSSNLRGLFRPMPCNRQPQRTCHFTRLRSGKASRWAIEWRCLMQLMQLMQLTHTHGVDIWTIMSLRPSLLRLISPLYNIHYIRFLES